MFLFTSSSLRVPALRAFGNSIEPFDKHLSSPLYLFSAAPTLPFLPLTNTPAVFLSLPPPLFSFHYIFIPLSWESSPPHRWTGKGAGSRRPRGKHFNSESKLSRGQRHRPLMGRTQRGEARRITIEPRREHSGALLL